MVQLAGKPVGELGYGLMGMTWRDNPVKYDTAFSAMKAALENGSNFWNGGEIYGKPEHNSLHLLRDYFKQYPEDKDKVVISIKGSYNHETYAPDSSPESARRSVDQCLKVLGDSKFLDIFECARVDPKVPIEDTIEALAEYVKAGKLGGISLSEASADTIKRASKVHKIECVELEMSMFSTELLDTHREISETCAQLGIPIIAYSPLGRGLLTGQVRSLDDLPEGDLRRHQPRFQPENFKNNLDLVDQVKKIAEKKGLTSGQVAIAWVRQQSGKNGLPTIIPIPGATARERVLENSKHVQLSSAELQEIDDILKKTKVAGGRYPDWLDALSFGDTPPRK